MLETIICLPFLFLMIFLTAQLAHIMFCRQIVQYASVAAGRATITCSDQEEEKAATAAARRICALISYTDEGGTPLKRNWINANGSGGAAPDGDKLNVEVVGSGIGDRNITVEFFVPMLFPFANGILAGTLDWWNTGFEPEKEMYSYGGDNVYFPHIKLTGKTVVFKPAVVETSAGVENYEGWN